MLPALTIPNTIGGVMCHLDPFEEGVLGPARRPRLMYTVSIRSTPLDT